MAARIRKGDLVKVIAGKDRNKTGRVIRVLADADRVVVEGVNTVFKNVKPNQRFPQGSRIEKSAAIHVSNVMPIDPETGKATRVRTEVRDGVRHRVAVKSGKSLGAARKSPKAKASA